MGKRRKIRQMPDGLGADFTYTGEAISLDRDFEPPTYQQIASWVKSGDSPSLAYDFWCRGNYLKHIAHRAKSADPTVVVSFRYLDELQAYWRRCALMGVASQFVYTGRLTEGRRFLSLCPGDDDFIHDGGAGSLIVASEPMRFRGREWLWTIGYAKLMPDTLVEWLFKEAGPEFETGHTFIAPAELIGLPLNDEQLGFELAADLMDSAPAFSSMQSAEVLFNIDLPNIEEMDTPTFRKILEDHDFRLARFRHAMGKVISGVDNRPEDVIAELRDEVAQLALSDANARLRQQVSRFGGVFTTFTAGLTAFGSAIAKSGVTSGLLPTAGAAATGGAVAAMVDLWKQGLERRAKRREHRFSICWDLGLRKPNQLSDPPFRTRIRSVTQSTTALIGANYNCHWLCPPGQAQFVFQAAR
jgi:hypothetical protein